MFAQHNCIQRAPDERRIDDLVGEPLFEDPILVDSRLMGKGVLADDCFVRLDLHPRELAHQLAGAVDLFCADSGLAPVQIPAGIERHDDLFQGGVARPLSDAVDRALHLPRPGLDRRQRVCHGQAEIVVAVDADHGSVDIGYLLEEGRDKIMKFEGGGVAHCVGDINRRRSGGDSCLDNAAEKVMVAAKGILGGEFDIGEVTAGVLHRRRCRLKNLFAAQAQLMLKVDIRGGDEGVNPRRFGLPDRLPGAVDIARLGSC